MIIPRKGHELVDERKESSGDREKSERDNASLQSRRSFITKLLLLLPSLVLIGSSLSSIIRTIIPPITEKTPEETSSLLSPFIYRKVEGTWFFDKAGQEAKVEDFELGRGASVLWQGNIPAVLIKADPSKLEVKEGTDQGFVAFCAKCTHLCCIPNYQIDRLDTDKIFCHCHGGIYDPYKLVKEEYKGTTYYGAKVIAGPPPRAIPQIPVKIRGGKVLGDAVHPEWYDYCG